jgi:hypothetical protein
MNTAKCKCGKKQAWGEMPPCAICEECGTAPGYSTVAEPTPHRFKKQFDQNTGEPYMRCFTCMKKEPIAEETA